VRVLTHKDKPFRNCSRDAMHTWQWGNKQFHNTQPAMERCFAESSDVSKIMTALQANGLITRPRRHVGYGRPLRCLCA